MKEDESYFCLSNTIQQLTAHSTEPSIGNCNYLPQDYFGYNTSFNTAYSTKRQYVRNGPSSLYEAEVDHWLSDPDNRLVSDLEKGLSNVSEKIDIEIDNNDLSPVENGNCNLDIFSDIPGNKNHNFDYSCLHQQIQLDHGQFGERSAKNGPNLKYCNLKFPLSNCEYSQYIPSSDCFQDVSVNEICSEFNLNGNVCDKICTFVNPVKDCSFFAAQEVEDHCSGYNVSSCTEYKEHPCSEYIEKIPETKCCVCKLYKLSAEGHYFGLSKKIEISKENSTFEKFKWLTNNFVDNYFVCGPCFSLIKTIESTETKLKNCIKELDSKLRDNNENKNRLTKCSHKITCKVCKKSMSLLFLYRKHLQKHTKFKNRLLCEICGCSFLKLTQFKRHLSKHIENSKTSKNFLHSCNICSKHFKTTSNLKEHRNYCSGEMPFKCTKCDKKFSTSTKLKNHVKLKHEKKFNAICSICNIGFMQLSEYKRHMISHSTVKKYVCQTCNKAYKTLGNLNFHLKSHKIKLPFICEVCTKGFMRKEYLDAHTALHTGEKNYPCTICEKKFSSQKNLEAHLKYHDSNINKKSCNICGKMVNKFIWEDHLRTHSNLKEIECDKCEMRFNTKGAHQKHKKRKHGIENM